VIYRAHASVRLIRLAKQFQTSRAAKTTLCQPLSVLQLTLENAK